MLLPVNLQARHNIILYVCRRCNTLYVLILRRNGHVSLSRSPRLHAQPSVRTSPAREHRRFRTCRSACVPLYAHGMLQTGKLQKSTCVRARVYTRLWKAQHPRVLSPSARHYRRLNPVYIDGYPAEIRLGWRLAYATSAATGSPEGGRRAANEDVDLKSARERLARLDGLDKRRAETRDRFRL